MNISILGTGAYGIALATVLGNKNNVRMWTKFSEEREALLELRENKKLLPGIKLKDDVQIFANLEEAIKDADIIYLAIPMNALDSVVLELSRYVKNNQILCITSKGIDEKTGLFPSQIIEKNIPNFSNIAMISGPSFAMELASFAPTGFVVASKDEKVADKVKQSISSQKISVELTDDILGVQILATIKNIYAIFLGMLSGINAYESTKASILKCIINDCREILECLGGKRESAYSFAGLGDLLLTCMSNKSRNFSFGYNFSKCNVIKEALDMLGTKTVEGLYSLEAINKMLKEKNIEIASINYIYEILYNNLSIESALINLNKGSN